MSSTYNEHPPSARLASTVACFWFFQTDTDVTELVVPDGCIDILVRSNRAVYSVDVIGSMSRAELAIVPAGHSYLGVRFKPGQIKTLFPSLDCKRLVDQSVPLAALSHVKVCNLANALSASLCAEEHIALLERILQVSSDTTTCQNAIDLMVSRHGNVDVDELTDAAQLSERQFRRHCIELTGLPPKALARVLRLKRACTLLKEQPCLSMAELAQDCDFFDQAHMNREFQALMNLTPLNFARQQN
jgi:AraC-like DNA-binding protein